MNKKSISTVVIGVLFVIIASTVVDVILHKAGVYPPLNTPMDDSLSLLALSYRIVISIYAGYLTARLAPDRPVQHALYLGYVGTVLGLIGVVGTWNMGMGPHWYPIALAVLAIPQCWLGGKIAEKKLATAA
jgi:hypothetical protein